MTRDTDPVTQTLEIRGLIPPPLQDPTHFLAMPHLALCKGGA